jgi:hypothetical protein
MDCVAFAWWLWVGSDVQGDPDWDMVWYDCPARLWPVVDGSVIKVLRDESKVDNALLLASLPSGFSWRGS